MATVTLRPDGSGDNNLTTIVGAATAHQALSDESDASYITQSTTQGAYLYVTLSGFTLPINSVVRYTTVRARMMEVYTFGNTGNSAVIIDLDIANAQTWSYNQFIPLPVSAMGEMSGRATDSSSFDQNYINNLGLFIHAAGNINRSTFVRVGAIYVDVTYTVAPVVVATAPIGAVTTTTSPTVTWTYTTDADGGPQGRWSVRVFSAAQYGLAGFNPDNALASWENASEYGSATSTVVGPLPSPGTYRAYVRAAQVFNSIPQWSAWSYTSFTVTVASPTIASVTATADDANARNRVTVSRVDSVPVWTSVDVERSSDGGVTWQAVRGATNVSPPGDVWIGYDYEAGNGVSVIYRARGVSSVGPAAGPWTVSAAVTWASVGDWLKDPDRPARSRQVTVQNQPSVVRSRARGVFRPIGRADAVVISDVRQLIVGEMSLLTDTDDEADDLNALLGADVLLFQTRPGERFGSRYLSVGDIEEVREGNVTNPSRTWHVPFVEVLPSIDTGIVVAGLTWRDLVDTYESWQTVMEANPSWGIMI